MKPYVVDTHALFWYLTDSPRLGRSARQAFDEAARGEAQLLIPAVVLAELFFINEKAKEPGRFVDDFNRLRSAAQFAFVDFEAEHVGEFETDAAISEMHDRMIVGVARRAGATLLSRDAQLTSRAAVPVVW